MPGFELGMGTMNENLGVSVGICAYNEGKNIGGLIENLLNQPVGNHELTEIVVVASGCTDETIPVVQTWCNKNRKVKLIVEPKRNGKAAAINKLLRAMKGDVLVHVSADLFLSQDALQPLLDHFNDPSVGGVSGSQTPLSEGRFMDKINSVTWGLHNETQRYYNHLGGTGHLGGDLFAIRRGICHHVPEDIVNDDAFMGVGCKRKGYEIHFEDKVTVLFQGPKNIFDLLVQRRRVVYGHLKVKRETGIYPSVLEMSPLKDKFIILRRWIQKNRRLFLHFIVACLLEVYANILARWDMLKKGNPHKIWKMATTTKIYYNDRTAV